MSANVLRFQKKENAPSDWSQGELAQFYRVAATLNRGGLAIETDRGLSDEGDPWFIFCRAGTDDVIVHFARCNGVYIIASPGLDQVARGRDFAALMEPLIAQYVPYVKVARSERKSVTLHPSALLFALVVTCLFNAERSEAHTLIPAKQESDVAPAAGIQAQVSLEGVPPSATESSGNGRQLVMAFAAAIGSAVTFEQWQAATSYIAVEPSHPDESTPIPAATAHTEAQDLSQVAIPNAQSPERHEPPVSPMVTVEEATVPNLKSPSAAVDPNAQHSFDVGKVASNGGQGDLAEGERNFRWSSEAHSTVAHIGGAPMPWSVEISQVVPTQATDRAPSQVHTQAYQDIAHVLGDTLASHEVSDQAGGEPNLILGILETQSVDGTHETVQAAGAQQQNTTSNTDGSADTSNAQNTPVAPPTVNQNSPGQNTSGGAGMLTQVNPTDAQVEIAVGHFIAQHPDFQLLDTNNEMILYDPHIDQQAAPHVEVAAYLLSDGSSVILVGLSQGMPMGLG